MTFKIPQLVPTDKEKFIEFWAVQYFYALGDGLYNENIGQPLTAERIKKLYRWKNGMNLSAKKNDLLDRVYIPQLEQSPRIETLEDGKEYIKNLNGGKIWDFFGLHCLNPKLFPIFDRYTYEAMADIEGLPQRTIPSPGKKMVEAYFSQYVPFVSKIGADFRRIDKALFAYGKVLEMPLFQSMRES